MNVEACKDVVNSTTRNDVGSIGPTWGNLPDRSLYGSFDESNRLFDEKVILSPDLLASLGKANFVASARKRNGSTLRSTISDQLTILKWTEHE